MTKQILIILSAISIWYSNSMERPNRMFMIEERDLEKLQNQIVFLETEKKDIEKEKKEYKNLYKNVKEAWEIGCQKVKELEQQKIEAQEDNKAHLERHKNFVEDMDRRNQQHGEIVNKIITALNQHQSAYSRIFHFLKLIQNDDLTHHNLNESQKANLYAIEQECDKQIGQTNLALLGMLK